MSEEIFFPTLEDEDGGVVTDPVRMVHQLIAFIFSNPGNTSDLFEGKLASIGKLAMEFGDRPSMLASECETLFQKAITEMLGDYHNYTVLVEVEAITDTQSKLNLLITDSLSGENILTRTNEIINLTGSRNV